MRLHVDRISDGHGNGYRSEIGLDVAGGAEFVGGVHYGAGGGGDYARNGRHGDGYGNGLGAGGHMRTGRQLWRRRRRDGGGFGYGDGVLPMSNEYAARTERLFRCAGCVGGFECSIHGRRL